MKLFKGLSEDSWTDRLKLRGYPDHAARQIAAFLVGREQEPPGWEGLNEAGGACHEPHNARR